MYYHHWFILRFEKNCIFRQSWQFPNSVSRGVIFRLRISPRIRSRNRNGSKCSVRDLCRTDLRKNPRKPVSLPSPFNSNLKDGLTSQCCWLCGQSRGWGMELRWRWISRVEGAGRSSPPPCSGWPACTPRCTPPQPGQQTCQLKRR